MGKNKMKTEDIKIHGRSHGNCNRRLETAASKRSIAADFAVPESTLRKRQHRLLWIASKRSFQMRKRNNRLICRDSEARFFIIKDLAFDYAERKVIDNRFNKEKKNTGKEWVTSFYTRSNLSDCSKNATLEEP